MELSASQTGLYILPGHLQEPNTSPHIPQLEPRPCRRLSYGLRSAASHNSHIMSHDTLECSTCMVYGNGLLFSFLYCQRTQCKFLSNLEKGVHCNRKHISVFKPCTGTTNTVVLLQHEQQRAILRINGRGSDKLVDRDREAETMVVVSQAGLCCSPYCQFENGMCYGYAPGRPLQLEDVQEDTPSEGEGSEKKEELARKVALHMARLHSLHLPTSLREQEPLLWTKYDCWLEGLPTELEKDHHFFSEIGTLDVLKTESHWLKQKVANTHSPVLFCHNDLNKPNVIFDEFTDAVTFVDFEYAGPNYLAYDVANWLCETQIELEIFPSDSYCRRWIAMYIESVEKLKRENEKVGEAVCTQDTQLESKHAGQGLPDTFSPKRTVVRGIEELSPRVMSLELSSLHREVNIFSLVSHLVWCVWALHMTQTTQPCEGFDYMKYAILRHSLFVKYREEFGCDK